jgi:FkbM family methyltransferase
MPLPLNFKPKKKFELIRIGKNNDGGYLCGLNSVRMSKNLISLGVFDDISFEKNFRKLNNNCKINFYDKYVDNVFWLKILWKNLGLSIFKLNPLFFLRSLFKYVDFYNFVKKNKFYRKTIDFNSVNKILKKNKTFLKIDIEGSEYRVLQEIIKHQKKIIALVIEFHDVDLNLEKINDFIKKFKLTLTHIHPNNAGDLNYYKVPLILEMTFEKYPVSVNEELIFPHEFDQNNAEDKPSINLVFKKF